MQAVCAKCSRLMCRAVVLFLVAECAQTTPMIAPLPGDPNFSIDGSVAFFKSGESNPTQPNPTTPAARSPLTAGQGDSVGPPHPRTRAHGTWVADPNSPLNGRAVGEGAAPDPRRPSRWWKAPPEGTPFCHPHSEQREPARAHAVEPVLSPYARTDRTRDAEPWLPVPEDGRQGEGQRLTPGAPHNSGRPAPPGTAPHHPGGMQPSQGMQAKGTAPTPTHRRPQHVGGGPQQPALEDGA